MEQVKKRALLRWGDLAAIILVLALAGVLLWYFFAAEKGSVAEIAVDGAVVETVSLRHKATYPIEANGHKLTVCVEDGEVFVIAADCPDKVCERTGRISAKGASIVCAEAHVSVSIRGEGDADVDYVAG